MSTKSLFFSYETVLPSLLAVYSDFRYVQTTKKSRHPYISVNCQSTFAQISKFYWFLGERSCTIFFIL